MATLGSLRMCININCSFKTDDRECGVQELCSLPSLTKEVVKKFKWDIFSWPPCSPDLVPSDYYLFLDLRKWLVLQRFEEFEKLEIPVENFYIQGLKKLVHDIKVNKVCVYFEPLTEFSVLLLKCASYRF